MFKFFKELGKKENKDIRKRILFTLLALFIFKLGTAIQVPGTESITSDLGFLEFFNAMGGGALKNFSIFALGVSPYITTSLIIPFLTEFIPYFADLRDQGQSGRAKLNQITRYMAIAVAFIQGYLFSFAFLGDTASAVESMQIALILTTGTAFLLWLGDQISAKGIGNGISLIIMAGIVSTLPTMFYNAFISLITFGEGNRLLLMGLLSFGLFTLTYLLVIIGVVFIQISERRLPIQYANKSSISMGKQQSYMPIRIMTAGVIPVIFASSIMSFSSLIAEAVGKESLIIFVEKYITYTTPVGFIIYALLIVFFAYFYTYFQLKPKELSENLNKGGGYIPGIRPGQDTEKYINQVLSRITLVGAVVLIAIVALPIIFSSFTSLPTSVTIGGTGLLIAVGVSIETYKQIESTITSRTYYGGKR